MYQPDTSHARLDGSGTMHRRVMDVRGSALRIEGDDHRLKSVPGTVCRAELYIPVIATESASFSFTIW